MSASLTCDAPNCGQTFLPKKAHYVVRYIVGSSEKAFDICSTDCMKELAAGPKPEFFAAY